MLYYTRQRHGVRRSSDLWVVAEPALRGQPSDRSNHGPHTRTLSCPAALVIAVCLSLARAAGVRPALQSAVQRLRRLPPRRQRGVSPAATLAPTPPAASPVAIATRLDLAVSDRHARADALADHVADANCASDTTGHAEPDTDPRNQRASRPANADAPSQFPQDSVIVTFKVVNQEYRVLVTDPANVAIARAATRRRGRATHSQRHRCPW